MKSINKQLDFKPLLLLTYIYQVCQYGLFHAWLLLIILLPEIFRTGFRFINIIITVNPRV